MHPEALIYFTSDRSADAPGIYPYGLCMAGGIVLCFAFLLFTMWKKKFNEGAIDKILIIGVFGTGFGIFAALLFQSMYNYIAEPEKGFRLGGMTFIGGLIGGVVSFLAVYFLYIYVIAPRTKIKFLKNNMNATLTDALPFIPIGICIAHAFGRLGCFFAGCCYGLPSDQFNTWGLPCANAYHSYSWVDTDGIAHSVYDWTGINVIPTQLYEMFFLILLAAVMALLYFKFRLNYNFSVYMISYGIWRFLIEFIRGDVRGEFIGTALYPSQIWSIVMVIAGVGYIFLQKYVLAGKMKHPELAVAAASEGSSAENQDNAAEDSSEPPVDSE